MNDKVIPIWHNFKARLHEYICKKVNHQDHCNDILQDVYIKIINNIDRVENANNINSYLTRIAANAVNDYYRANFKNISGSVDLTNAADLRSKPVEEEKETIELADCCLRPMIDSLPSMYREALILTELEGLSQRQLAERLNISFSGAKSRIQRAREKLKRLIMDCCLYEFDKYGNIIDCCRSC